MVALYRALSLGFSAAGALVPRNWQVIYSAPRPVDFDPVKDKRARAVDRQLRIFAGLAPGFTELHPISADSLQECTEITAHAPYSLETFKLSPAAVQKRVAAYVSQYCAAGGA